MFSGPAELVAKQATKDQIVQISFSATSSALSSSQYSYFFRTIPPDDLQAQALEALMLNFDLNSVFIIHHNDRWANSLVSDFYNKDTLVIQNQSYNNFESDFSFLMSKINQEKQNFDAFLLISLVDDVKLILPAIKQAGVNNPLFGTEANVAGDLMDDPNSTIYPEVFSGTVSHIFTRGEFGYDNFSNALLGCSRAGICLENNSESNYDAYAYDALWIGAKAIKMADFYQGFDIKSNMDKAGDSYIGATGNKSFTENGDPIFSLFDIYQFQNTQYTNVGTWNTISGLSLNNNVVSVTVQPIQVVGSTVTTVKNGSNYFLFDIPIMLDSLIQLILVASSVFLLVIVIYVIKIKKIVGKGSKKEKNTYFKWFQKLHNEEKLSLSDETFNMLEEMIEETKDE